jgi:hypothetical protein
MNHPLDREYLKDLSRTIANRLPDNHSFILLATQNGEGGNDARIYYTSNMTRESAVNCLKEFLIKCGAEEDWMKHLK